MNGGNRIDTRRVNYSIFDDFESVVVVESWKKFTNEQHWSARVIRFDG